MSEAQEVVDRFAEKEYGQFVFVDAPIYDERNKLYSANIRSKIPVFIHDDRLPKYQVRVLKIDSLGKLYLSSNLQLMSEISTLRDKCYENLDKMLEVWRMRTENLIVSTTASNLVTINNFRFALSKFELILDHMDRFHEIKNVELRTSMPTEDKKKLPRYLSLLEDLQYVRKVEKGYVPGNQLIQLEDRKDVDEETRRLIILTNILKSRYLTLKDVFRLSLLELAIKIENMVYLPELELGDSIYQKYSSIERAYKHHYKENINPLHLTRNLTRLEKCGAIKRENNRYHGVEDYREEMMVLKKKFKPLTIYAQ